MVHHDMTREDTYERMNSGSASKPKTTQGKILHKANETQAMGLKVIRHVHSNNQDFFKL